METRLRALCDLFVPEVREYAGRHEYDGQVAELSPQGVRAGLARLGGPALPDPHDDAHLTAFEALARVLFGELEEHRRNPAWHLMNLELSSYDRPYAPEQERLAARRRHLGAWPDAVAMARASLDAVPAPLARGLLPAARGLAVGLDADRDPVEADAVRAHGDLMALLEAAERDGDPDPALGAAALARLMGAGEAVDVDLGALAARADADRRRLREVLDDACRALHPDLDTPAAVASLLADHPDADGVLDEARSLTEEVLAFTADAGLVPGMDGTCLVGPAPPARRWAMAMMSPAAPGETETPSWYHVTPPDPSWPAHEQAQWLAVFSRTTLPAITAHEVAPGHFAHFRVLRTVPSPVRRTLQSPAFIEGWAHYAEQVCVEEGFRKADPRFAAGVAIEALIRVTRLAVAIGLHSGDMTLPEATRRFADDAFLQGPAAESEAVRGTFDPSYGRYTWGRWAILDLRDQARSAWGASFSLPRFHQALLALGAPPLGLMGAVLAGDGGQN